MSGVSIVRTLLAANAALTAQVPAERIRAGDLLMDTAKPAISIKRISGRQHNNAAMASASYLVTERVQVTAVAVDASGISGYAKVKELQALIRAALPLSRGTINGFDCDAVLPDIEGPDLFDYEAGIYSASLDYMVTYHR